MPGHAVGPQQPEGGGGRPVVVQEGAQEPADGDRVVRVGVGGQILQRDGSTGQGLAVEVEELAVPGDLTGQPVLLETADAPQPLGVLEQVRQACRLVLYPPDEQHTAAVPADADVGDRRQRHVVQQLGEPHTAGAEGLPRGEDAFDLLEQPVLTGGHRIRLQQEGAAHHAPRPARGVQEAGVDMLDAEVDEFPRGIDVRDEDQGGVVEPVGQIHQLCRVEQGPGPQGAVVVPRVVRLQGVGAQLRQSLDLPDDLRGLGLQPGRPDDLQDTVDAARGAGRHRDPAAVGVLVPADGGQTRVGQSADPLARAFRETPARHGRHTRRHVPPASRFRGGETGAARKGERTVGAQGPDGNGHRAERGQRVGQQGVGDALRVRSGQCGALRGAQFHGGRALVRRAGRDGPARRGREEGGRHFGEPVPRGLVDHLDGELERCHTRLSGELGQLPGGLCRPAPQTLDEDALGQFDQGASVRLRLCLADLLAQPLHGRREPADRRLPGGHVLAAGPGPRRVGAAGGSGQRGGTRPGGRISAGRRVVGGCRIGRLVKSAHDGAVPRFERPGTTLGRRAGAAAWPSVMRGAGVVRGR
jgi:hypothetical protein